MEELVAAVDAFGEMSAGVPDEAMGRRWVWGGYSDEGVRFAWLTTLLELRRLVVRIAAARPAPTQAQRILAQHHAAYRGMRALLLGLSDAEFDRTPAEGEWPARTVLEHMMGTEGYAFRPQIVHALERHRAGEARPGPAPRAEVAARYGEPELAAGTMAEMVARYDALHVEVLRDLSGITDEELEAPSIWWEGYPMPLRFRLHRFEAHVAQHAIQLEKTLDGIGHRPTEAERLARDLYRGLAEVEGALIDAEDVLSDDVAHTARKIAARAEEVREVLAG